VSAGTTVPEFHSPQRHAVECRETRTGAQHVALAAKHVAFALVAFVKLAVPQAGIAAAHASSPSSSGDAPLATNVQLASGCPLAGDVHDAVAL